MSFTYGTFSTDVTDAGPTDAGVMDAGAADAGAPDGVVADAASPDVASRDGSHDRGTLADVPSTAPDAADAHDDTGLVDPPGGHGHRARRGRRHRHPSGRPG